MDHLISTDTRGLGVVNFYHNSAILISGATGFMGQVLLEKILRTLKPRTVYMLIRKKRDLNAVQRLQELLAGELFEKVQRDNLCSCIVPVEVDYTHECLAISAELQQVLVEEVDVIFNLIASVKFNEPLDVALKTNVEYTRNFFRLFSASHRLKAAIHVSTFYSNCDRSFIDEKIYEGVPFGGYERLQQILAELSPEEIEILTPYVVGKFPNTYSFSKKCGELMVQDHFGSLPMGIFRPPIVSSIHDEPIPGWTNNFNGPSGVFIPMWHGLLQVIPTDARKRPFIAPVDYCINGMLSCAVDVYRNHNQCSGKIPVYNFTSDMPDWGTLTSWVVESLPPSKKIFGLISERLNINPVVCYCGKQLMRLQGHFMDAIGAFMGQKTQVASQAEKRILLAESLRFFASKEWKMDNRNMRLVIDSLSTDEAEQFPCNLATMDWPTHWKNFVPGVQKYALEPLLKRAKNRAKLTN